MNVVTIGKSERMLKSFPEHSHSCWEIIYNTHGNGYYRINDEIICFKQGDLIIIPPNLKHYKTSDGTYNDIYLQVKSIPLNSLYYTADDVDKNIFNLLQMLFRIYHKKEKGYEEISNSLLDAILKFILKTESSQNKFSDIEKFKNILVNNFSDPEFKLNDAFQQTNYTKDHFRRLFKYATGETPVAYLQNLRIEYAKNLLKNIKFSNFSINEIAYMCGYYDQRYFSRIFKNKTGYTPKEFSSSLQ